MPHAALWVVQLSRLLRATPPRVVSMPHAALWVVQHPVNLYALDGVTFQCRTRLFPFAPTTASRSPSPARAGEAFRLRYAGFSPRCAGRGLLQSTVAA